MSNKDWRIGIDVGGTNTDAVVLDENLNLISAVKSPTTEDVMSGIENAMEAVLAGEGVDRSRIGYAMLGTTHCTNAIVERKRLDRVAVIRIGAPATRAIKPMIDWPAELRAAINDQWFLVGGGHEFDGREIAPLDEDELRRIANQVKGECDSVAITSVFSPVDASHETRAAAIMREALGDDFPISISSEIGSVSLLERENATILNAALVDVAKTTSESFIAALAGEDITDAEVYLCQNDGTLMSAEYAMRYPILTIACGPTNSIRGASFLTGLKDAVVVDVGGTTTDLGVLTHGFPRESMLAVEIGGVRTNFRMPDIISIGLGGGSIVRQHEDGTVTVGPDSVGYRVTKEALCFGGHTLTATDIVVAAGAAEGVGDPALVADLDPELVKKITDTVRNTDHVLGMHDLIIHDYGPGTRMMTLHLEVPSNMTLLDSHMLADQLETSLRSKFGIQTVIHVDPVVTDDKEAALLREKLSGFLQYLGPDFLYHDFRIVHEKDRLKVLFDVNCPYNVRMSDDEIQDYLKQEFDKIRPGISLRVGVDHYTRS